MESLDFFTMMTTMDISEINPMAVATLLIVSFVSGIIYGMTHQ